MNDDTRGTGLYSFVSREEVSAFKTQLLKEKGLREATKILHKPETQFRAKVYATTRNLFRLWALLGYSHAFFVLLLPIILFFLTRWYWALASILFDLLIVQRIHNAVNLELYARIYFTDRSLYEQSAGGAPNRQSTSTEADCEDLKQSDFYGLSMTSDAADTEKLNTAPIPHDEKREGSNLERAKSFQKRVWQSIGWDWTEAEFDKTWIHKPFGTDWDRCKLNGLIPVPFCALCGDDDLSEHYWWSNVHSTLDARVDLCSNCYGELGSRLGLDHPIPLRVGIVGFFRKYLPCGCVALLVVILLVALLVLTGRVFRG